MKTGTREPEAKPDDGRLPARATRLRQARGRQVHPLNLLLLAAPLAVAAAAWHWSPVALFCASGLAIVPLARLIGVATEVLGGRLGAAAGGLLNATFGNATELFIAIVAL